VLRLAVALLVVAAIALTCFAVSVFALPLLPHNQLPRAKELRESGNLEPRLTERQKAKTHFVLKRDKRQLTRAIRQDREKVEKDRLSHLSAAPVNAISPFSGKPVVAAYYVNWEETSRASLRRNVREITHFFPEWFHLNGDGRTFADVRIPEDKSDIDPFVRSHGIPIIPVINNYNEAGAKAHGGPWDTGAIHRLVANPANRAAFIASLRSLLVASKWQGINLDFEEIAQDDRDALTEFVKELHEAFKPAGLLVTQAVQLESDGFDIPALAQYADAVIPMAYDQHSPGDENGAGAIAGIDWTRNRLAEMFRQVPANKVILGLGSYAYDWPKGSDSAASLSYQTAVVQAKESQDPKDPSVARVEIDPKTLNPFYRYFDDDGKPHVVWMMDATTAYNQWAVAAKYRPLGYSLWYLGSEDPGIWRILGRSQIWKSVGQIGKLIDSHELDRISYGRQSQVDFEGEGELLDVVAEPNEGHRTVARDPKTGLIDKIFYENYPSSFVVRRYGYKPKSVVLTFDDGPDPNWTPRILDILKQEGVKGTFFMVGQQAMANPGLVARVWDEGNEIGNHTWSHPNLAESSKERTLLEITTTQHLIEAVTGHSTTLFRPPYAIDVEPRTGGELRPIIAASKWDFTSVGEKIDPQDWNLTAVSETGKTGVDRIVEAAWNDRNAGNVILLHDAGGDRSATVAALPRIIEMYKKAGYRFITIADLRGVSRDVMFPSISGREIALVGVDKWVFEATYLWQRVIVTLFTLSVVLGVSRQLFMTILALIRRRGEGEKRRRGDRETGPAGAEFAVSVGSSSPPLLFSPPVSVVIAAYNEAKVIARTVRTVLESDYPEVEVIVVDDGSTDDTFGVVSAEFGGDSRVLALRKENGGKASALNFGLTHAKGEVIVALDADTLFAKETVRRLARHFADPEVGAVSGNVRVGNANNILTKWQALEYITSQNFDRRAYDLLNCITVVPGAVGAWRRQAIRDVGGYTSDTLAEDMDLTWKIRRAGWRILNDSSALAFTEAPESLRNLARQRYRWAFGTLQNLWKHRAALARHGAFGLVALPSLWMYQILFPAISPIMDVTVVWAIFAGNAAHVLAYYGLMVGVEFLGAALALWMDKGSWKLLPWLFLQRFVYRQMMYYVILKSIFAAVRGGAVGWNKFERRGTAQMETVRTRAPGFWRRLRRRWKSAV